MARHGHDGLERACVMRGAFVDASERYAAGDVAEPDGDDDHRPLVDGPDPCRCVIAGAGMQLRAFLGLAQRPLIR
jgi:putative transcriptional regulator